MLELFENRPRTKDEFVSAVHELADGFVEFGDYHNQTLISILYPMIRTQKTREVFVTTFKGETPIQIIDSEHISTKQVLELFKYLSTNTMSLNSKQITPENLSQLFDIADALRMFFISLLKVKLKSQQ